MLDRNGRLYLTRASIIPSLYRASLKKTQQTLYKQTQEQNSFFAFHKNGSIPYYVLKEITENNAAAMMGRLELVDMVTETSTFL